jgi:hypothetical protein
MTDRRIAAIPTEYRGVHMRSRLEARHASFFDLVGWTWDYEPYDLNGYIPDFVIDSRLVIECKPSIGADWHVAGINKIARAQGLRRSGMAAVVSGSTPWVSGDYLAMGYRATVSGREPVRHDREVWFAGCEPCAGLTLCDVPPVHGGTCLRCGFAELYDLEPGAPEVMDQWREAGSVVQWRAADAYATSLFDAAKEEK